MQVENLRSPYAQTKGIYYFARMLDKIRLNEAGELPADYQPNLGIGFDGRCINFLSVKYPALVERVKEGGTDDEVLDWCFSQGRQPSAEEIEVWDEFMRKRGWNDEATPTLQRRLREGNFEDRTDIVTFFDFIDLDEERDPRSRNA
jgi:hypothetical protein